MTADVNVGGLVRLVRLRSTLGAPMLTLVGWFVSGEPGHPVRLVFAATSAFATIGFSQVFNDIVDRELDTVDKPGRPIPSGDVSIATARCAAIGLALVALTTGAAVGVTTGVLAVAGLVLGALYSWLLKGTILLGNAVVALVSSATLLFGVGRFDTALAHLVVGQSIVFIYILGNELFKTAVDVNGDAASQKRTIATALGLTATAAAIRVCAAVLVLIIIGVWLLNFAQLPFLLFALALIGLPVAVGALRIGGSRAQLAASIHSGHRVWRLGWLPGITVLLMLR